MTEWATVECFNDKVLTLHCYFPTYNTDGYLILYQVISNNKKHSKVCLLGSQVVRPVGVYGFMYFY